MIIERKFEIIVKGPIEGKVRLDSYMSKEVENLPRSAFSKPDCQIFVDGKIAKRSFAVTEGQRIEVIYNESVFEKIIPQEMPLEILYEDDYIVVINKKEGVVVHPGAGNYQDTLVNALAYRYGSSFLDEMIDEEHFDRPGIVHRLDKDTSGVIICARTKKALFKLSKQFQNREIIKHYLCFAEGMFLPTEGEINSPMCRDPRNRKKFAIAVGEKGKPAKTTYKVIKQYKSCALLNVRIYTGRTHQIRVHMKSIKHPIVGDPLYGSQRSTFADKPLMLHCFSMEFKHPITKEVIKIEAPMPQRFKIFEEELQSLYMK